MMSHHDVLKAMVVEHQQELERRAASWRLARRLRRRADAKRHPAKPANRS